MPPLINEEKCIGCGICADICSMQVFQMDKELKKSVVIYGEECWHCNSCVLDCKQNAISLRIPAPFMMLHVESATLQPEGK